MGSRIRGKLPHARWKIAAASSRRYWTHATVLLLVLATTARCSRPGPLAFSSPTTTLRVGFPEAGSVNEQEGIRQLRQLLSAEGLARIGENGRPVPRLAQGW